MKTRHDHPFALILATRQQCAEDVDDIISSRKGSSSSTRWLNSCDKFGWSALHYSCFNGNLAITISLVRAGADVNLRTERAGESPLFLAASQNNHSIVSYLLANKQTDPNTCDIIGKTPKDVAWGDSEFIISQEQLNRSLIQRFLPTIRKLLASKFMQLLLQLIICVFLELFHDKLLNVLQKILQLLVLFGPGVREFILRVLNRMMGPIVGMITPLINIVLLNPSLVAIQYFLQYCFTALFSTRWVFLPLLYALKYLLFQLSIPFITIARTLGFSMSLCVVLLIYIYKVVFERFLFVPLYYISNFSVLFWRNVIQNTVIYQSVAKFANMLASRFLLILWTSLQPKQLAAKLVSPFILGASKLLYLLPTTWVDAIAYGYMQIAGRSRHVSDEEIAAVSLLLAGVGIYIFGIVGCGYILRFTFFFMYHFDLLVGELYYLSELLGVFSDENYITFTLKPDGVVHELGLLFILFLFPIMLICRTLKWLFYAIYHYRANKQKKLQKKEALQRRLTLPIIERHSKTKHKQPEIIMPTPFSDRVKDPTTTRIRSNIKRNASFPYVNLTRSVG